MTDLRELYSWRYEQVLMPLANAIELHLKDHLSTAERIDRISARAKTIDSFIKKAYNLDDSGRPKYPEPLDQIQDQIGARVITYYKSDVSEVSTAISRYYRAIEDRLHIPDREWEFGYFGCHYILLLPNDVVTEEMDRSIVPRFFELQIKTLFQHAWSEAEHDLGYKTAEYQLESDDKRSLAFTSAQAWGADRVFDELFQKVRPHRRSD